LLDDILEHVRNIDKTLSPELDENRGIRNFAEFRRLERGAVLTAPFVYLEPVDIIHKKGINLPYDLDSRVDEEGQEAS